ncbi:hypothetical protein ACS0TY_033540 [Phlomoides rotata]
MEEFDSFIRDCNLIDLSLHARSYTWYRIDGTCKSRIDKILVNSLWVSRWPNSHLKGLRRSVSDHCPLILEIKMRDLLGIY